MVAVTAGIVVDDGTDAIAAGTNSVVSNGLSPLVNTPMTTATREILIRITAFTYCSFR
jgi:hypothetical protein